MPFISRGAVRYVVTTVLGGLAWTVVYVGGRIIAAQMGYGADLSVGDTFAVMIPTIMGVMSAIAIWDRGR